MEGPQRCPACGQANTLGYGRDASHLAATGDGRGFEALDEYGGTAVYQLQARAQCGRCWRSEGLGAAPAPAARRQARRARAGAAGSASSTLRAL